MWLHKGVFSSVLLLASPYAWNAYPVFIKICFIISVIAVSGIVIAMLNIYLWRIISKRKEEKKKHLAADINQLLLLTVVMEPSMQKDSGTPMEKFDTRPFLKLGLQDKDVRTILVSELINYRNYFSGSIADRVRKLYLALSLDKEARINLYKNNWEVKVNALTELFKMNLEVDHDYLRQLMHDKNRYIRDFARLSLIKFTKGDPLKLLREITEPISQWESFEIFLVFQQKQYFTLSSLEGLISPDRDPSLVSLSLKLAVYFKDLSAVKLIIDLIQTPDLKLRAEAISSLGKLGAVNAEAYLVSIYKEQPHSIQLEILTALGRIQSGRYLDFLENEFISSSDFEIKKHASDAIIKLHPLSEETIDKLLSNTKALDQRILSHSLNPLINAL
jgi:hypothetical protein